MLGWDELGQIFRAGRSHEELKAGEAEGVGWHMCLFLSTIALMLKRKTSFSVNLNSTLASGITSP